MKMFPISGHRGGVVLQSVAQQGRHLDAGQGPGGGGRGADEIRFRKEGRRDDPGSTGFFGSWQVEDTISQGIHVYWLVFGQWN